MTVFITSDTHFRHKNIPFMGDGRPFETIEEHDAALAENWNRTVRPRDTVIHLGDVAMSTRIESLKILDSLNGRKILVPGNHDYVSAVETESRRERYAPVYARVFDKVWPDMVRFGRVVMSHYPPAEIPDHGEEDRYPQMRPELFEGALYLHGHTHQGHTHTQLPGNALAISVGVDANSYRPVSIDMIPELTPHEREWIWYATLDND